MAVVHEQRNMSRRKVNIIEIMIMMGREAEAVLGGNDI